MENYSLEENHKHKNIDREKVIHYKLRKNITSDYLHMAELRLHLQDRYSKWLLCDSALAIVATWSHNMSFYLLLEGQ